MLKFFQLKYEPVISAPGLKPPPFHSSKKLVEKITGLDKNKIRLGHTYYPTKTTYVAEGSYGVVQEHLFTVEGIECKIAEKVSKDGYRLAELDHLGQVGNKPLEGVITMRSLNNCSIIMPLASGDLTDLFGLPLLPEQLDHICHNILLALNNLFMRKFFYFDMKGRNILYFTVDEGKIMVVFADAGSTVPVGRGFPATHTHLQLQKKGSVSVDFLSDHFSMWYVYIYQLCLLYSRLVLGPNVELPLAKTNKDTYRIVEHLCKSLKNRGHHNPRINKYVKFLNHLLRDLAKGQTDHKKRVETFMADFYKDSLYSNYTTQ